MATAERGRLTPWGGTRWRPDGTQFAQGPIG